MAIRLKYLYLPQEYAKDIFFRSKPVLRIHKVFFAHYLLVHQIPSIANRGNIIDTDKFKIIIAVKNENYENFLSGFAKTRK